MCDESDLAGFARVNRRQFTALGGAALLMGCSTTEGDAPGGAIVESAASIQTPDGVADGFFYHAAQARNPGIIMWPDVAGLRDAFMLMARRLAASGYSVLLANPYYRDARGVILSDFSEWRTEEGRAKIAPMRERLTPEAIMRDARAYVSWLDAQAPVDTARGIGANGYCMSGPFTVYAAAAVPERVRAAASFHGGGLVEEGDPQSPHNLLDQTRASYLFAIAQNDDAKNPDAKSTLRAAAAAAGVPAEIEVYPADHGWTVIDSPVYAKEQAERAWGRMLALFQHSL